MKTILVPTFGILLIGATLVQAQHPTMPAGMSHQEHLRQLQKETELKRRGALAMGFDQDASVHHFLLQRAGGTILVSSNDANDTQLIEQIRLHFRDIAQAFGQGLFDKPFETHGELPPGVAIMATNKQKISYRYEELPAGARVVIETTDRAALDAIHRFLRYQIIEHKTGDPLVAHE